MSREVGFKKGSTHTIESRRLISCSLFGKRGKFARRWKGDRAGYVAIHLWIIKHHGKADKCENKNCQKMPSSRFEWASISGENKRDISDYVKLCVRCHRMFDYGSLEINTSKGVFKREKIISAICPKCNHNFEVKL